VGNYGLYVGSIGGTYTVRPNLVVDGVVGFAYTSFVSVIPPLYQNVNFGLDVLHIPGTNGPDPRQAGQPPFSMTGYEDLGLLTSWMPQYKYDTSFTYSLNVGYTKGSHDLRFGTDIGRYRLNQWHPEFSGYTARGGIAFNSGVTSLNGGAAPNQFNEYAAFLLGLPSTMGKSLQNYDPMTTREWLEGYYFRDRWQVTRSLTLSLGLRWEYYPILTRDHSGIERYDPNTGLS
jgi:hypothetical protein